MPERTRSSRKLLVGVLAAIAVVIAAALAAPFLVPASFISSQIAALVNQKTGRDLRIAGPISISLFPRPALVAQDVTLASPAGGFSTDFLTAKTVDVALKPLSLLHGAIDIEQLKLSQPTISLEIDKSGERNWIFRPPRPTATTAPSTSSGRAPSFGAGDVMIVDGTVSYLDQRGGTKRTVGGLNMTVSLPSLDAPLKAAGAGTYNNEPVTLTLGVASPAELRAGRASAATIDITSARGTFAFQGTIETSDPPKAIGTTDFRTPSLRDLLAWARIAVAPQDSELGALSIAGKVDLSGPKLTLADAAITLDDVAAKGTLVLTRSDRQLELDLNDTALSGGKAAGKIVVDDSGPLPAIAASGHLTGITVNRLSLNIAGFETLSGTGDLAFDLTGSGKTMRELVASLNGSGSINFTNGTVGAAGLGPLMRNTIGPVVNDKTIPREIAYRSLSATATIRQGILRNDDLKLSGPQVSATGAGTLNLAPRQINYQWNPDIVGLGTAQVAITGAWENPEYKVESVSITKGLSIPGLKLR